MDTIFNISSIYICLSSVRRYARRKMLTRQRLHALRARPDLREFQWCKPTTQLWKNFPRITSSSSSSRHRSLVMNESPPETSRWVRVNSGGTVSKSPPYALTPNRTSGRFLFSLPPRERLMFICSFFFLSRSVSKALPKRHEILWWNMKKKKKKKKKKKRKWEINLGWYCVRRGDFNQQLARWGIQGGPWMDPLFASGGSGE